MTRKRVSDQYTRRDAHQWACLSADFSCVERRCGAVAPNAEMVGFDECSGAEGCASSKRDSIQWSGTLSGQEIA